MRPVEVGSRSRSPRRSSRSRRREGAAATKCVAAPDVVALLAVEPDERSGARRRRRSLRSPARTRRARPTALLSEKTRAAIRLRDLVAEDGHVDLRAGLAGGNHDVARRAPCSRCPRARCRRSCAKWTETSVATRCERDSRNVRKVGSPYPSNTAAGAAESRGPARTSELNRTDPKSAGAAAVAVLLVVDRERLDLAGRGEPRLEDDEAAVFGAAAAAVARDVIAGLTGRLRDSGELVDPGQEGRPGGRRERQVPPRRAVGSGSGRRRASRDRDRPVERRERERLAPRM